MLDPQRTQRAELSRRKLVRGRVASQDLFNHVDRRLGCRELLGWIVRLGIHFRASDAEREYVVAARTVGSTAVRLMVRHIAPNILPLMIVLAMIEVGQLILIESAISFIGFGIQPPTPSWGNMLTNASQYLGKAPYLIYPPGIAVLVTVLCLYLVGDGLRDALDPRLRGAVGGGARK